MSYRSVMLIPSYVLIWMMWSSLDPKHPWRAKYGNRIFPYAIWVKTATGFSVDIGLIFTVQFACVIATIVHLMIQ